MLRQRSFVILWTNWIFSCMHVLIGCPTDVFIFSSLSALHQFSSYQPAVPKVCHSEDPLFFCTLNLIS